MTSTRRSARPASRWWGLLGAAVLAAPGLGMAQPGDLFFERTVMRAADARCDLFAPDVSAALAAGAVQARGAALRAGADAEWLRTMERAARGRAAELDCRAPTLVSAAARVEDAFSGYARLTRITYPGEVAKWRADRSITRMTRWRLAQDARFAGGRMTFGLAGRDAPGALLAVAQFQDGNAPYAARLLLRDTTRTSGPYLDPRQGKALSRRLPPRSAVKSHLAEARSIAGVDLLPRDARSGWAFRFPAAAARELAALDPRESIAVEFLFSGEVVRTAYVEVGDFAAGRAFLQVASR